MTQAMGDVETMAAAKRLGGLAQGVRLPGIDRMRGLVIVFTVLNPDAHCSHPSLERAAKCSVIVTDEMSYAENWVTR